MLETLITNETKLEPDKLSAELWQQVPIKGAKGLSQLRDIVMSISEKRSPVWRFTLAPDFFMNIQAKPSRLRHRFECAAGIAEDAEKLAVLARSSKGIDCNYWKLKFTIQATSDDDWTIRPTFASWKRGVSLDPLLPLRDRIVDIFNAGRFDHLSPDVMLGQFCLICGKALADPVSQARLIGPECYGAVAGKDILSAMGGELSLSASAQTGGKIQVPKKPKEEEPPLMLVDYSSVIGRREKPIREYTVGAVKPYAQYETSVTILYKEPRKRNSSSVTVRGDNTFYRIERSGEVLFDSRVLVPVDMEQFHKRWASFKDHPAVTLNGRGIGSDIPLDI